MRPLEDCRLYTFVDTAYLKGRAPETIAQQLCDGGSDLIQLRAKGVSQDEIRRMAERIVPITKRAGVGLVINDYPEIAGEVGAEFCHLGQEDYGEFKRKKAKGKISDGQIKLGLSTHSPHEAGEAIREGTDYIAIGPVYATGTKPGRKPVTLEYVQWAAQHVKVPWFAIGGINLENLDEVLAAGTKRICVVSAVLNAPGVAEACLEFRKHLSANG
ncbi:MAG TPA: thiamine phosphate synthase [Verrucomicrobiae bacterium]|nr:thiamine phosphate synthase [Verrucomicrobiae bacterium]